MSDQEKSKVGQTLAASGLFDGQRWEYKFIGLKNDNLQQDEAQINILGQEGWELVGVLAAGFSQHLYFKRPSNRPS